ncbi:N-acetyltransferase [Alicyclobacillus macrosporangiidus]|uniref:N-acetyltransferase n=1 Tax=Alicyclobacillus macrosporangiidus TaxID=392015 RepID=UPI0009F807E2|nr:N-acetyltransferase [Alicyclobacillus macrosporangiidus]
MAEQTPWPAKDGERRDKVDPVVVRLKVNFKTLEEFRRFREYGLEELSMYEDLQANMIENDADSPFYGVYEDGRLVARMSLYPVSARFDRYFTPPRDHLELWKLEVLPGYKGKGYGRALVQHAQSFGLPIKTNVRCGAHEFFTKLGFYPVKYNPERDHGQNPYLWLPPEEPRPASS